MTDEEIVALVCEVKKLKRNASRAKLVSKRLREELRQEKKISSYRKISWSRMEELEKEVRRLTIRLRMALGERARRDTVWDM